MASAGPRSPAHAFRVIALGTRMPAWVDAGFAEYAKRLSRDWAIELVELKPERRDASRPAALALALEAEKIRGSWGAGYYRIALDEHGRGLTTSELAHLLASARERVGRIAFAIGSADGLAPAVKEGADLLLALSTLT